MLIGDIAEVRAGASSHRFSHTVVAELNATIPNNEEIAVNNKRVVSFKESSSSDIDSGVQPDSSDIPIESAVNKLFPNVINNDNPYGDDAAVVASSCSIASTDADALDSLSRSGPEPSTSPSESTKSSSPSLSLPLPLQPKNVYTSTISHDHDVCFSVIAAERCIDIKVRVYSTQCYHDYAIIQCIIMYEIQTNEHSSHRQG
jgi:hypothetical protein